MCDDKETGSHYLVPVQQKNCEAYFIKTLPKLALDCIHLCVLCLCSADVRLCSSAIVHYFFSGALIAVILLPTVKLKQLKGRSDEFCMPCAWLPMSFLLC